MEGTYPLGRVIGLDIYKADCVVRREGREQEIPAHGTRDKITFLSEDSRRRLAFLVCNTDVHFRTMITLTYPAVFPNDGKTVKRHLNAFLTWCRRRWGRELCYVWFLEFQQRGAPHIHILLSITRVKQDIADVAQAWYRIAQSGDEKHLLAGTATERIRKQDGAARYCVKYALKCYQKAVPLAYQDVGRFWGASRNVKAHPRASIEIDELSIRNILSDWQYRPSDDRPLYRVLYRTADEMRSRLDTKLLM